VQKARKKFSGDEYFIKPHSTYFKITEILNLKSTEFCTGTVSACSHPLN
jgi:hypothetical protein